MKIKIEKITKRYNGKNILDNVSLDFENGKTYCILGKNGAGKSTLLNIITNLVSYTSGNIMFDNVKYDSLPKYIKQKLGVLSENVHVIEELTAHQYLKFVGVLYGINNSELNRRINELINLFFIDVRYINKKQILHYSTGMKKVIAFCAAIINIPELLILDEPFAGLDSISAHKIISIADLYKNKNRILIFSTHNLAYVENMKPDMLLVIDEGKILFQGSISNFTDGGKTKLDKALLKAFNFENDSQNTQLTWL
jgi:ABC-2 type transport system ATP-binding protein